MVIPLILFKLHVCVLYAPPQKSPSLNITRPTALGPSIGPACRSPGRHRTFPRACRHPSKQLPPAVRCGRVRPKGEVLPTAGDAQVQLVTDDMHMQKTQGSRKTEEPFLLTL